MFFKKSYLLCSLIFITSLVSANNKPNRLAHGPVVGIVPGLQVCAAILNNLRAEYIADKRGPAIVELYERTVLNFSFHSKARIRRLAYRIFSDPKLENRDVFKTISNLDLLEKEHVLNQLGQMLPSERIKLINSSDFSSWVQNSVDEFNKNYKAKFKENQTYVEIQVNGRSKRVEKKLYDLAIEVQKKLLEETKVNAEIISFDVNARQGLALLLGRVVN